VRFVRAHSFEIRGRVLELDPSRLAEKLGCPTVLDRISTNPDDDSVTILADPGEQGFVASDKYECVVMGTSWIREERPRDVLANMWAGVADGGRLLVAVPTRSASTGGPLSDELPRHSSGFHRYLTEVCPKSEIRIVGFGNADVSSAQRFGLSIEDVPRGVRDNDDARAPSLLGACIEKGT